MADNEAEDDKDFKAGFSDDPKEKTTKSDAVTVTSTDEVVDPPVEAGDTGVVETDVKTEGTETPVVPKKVKYVKLTEDEVAKFRGYETETAELKKGQAKAFGTIGSLQQQLNALKGKAEGKTEEKPVKEAADPITDSVQKIAAEELEDAYPDWRTIVGRPTDAGNAFRTWLGKQPEDYRKKINETNSSRVVERAIDRFKEQTDKPPVTTQTADKAKQVEDEKAAAVRRDRIASAVPPRTTGATPPRNKTDEEEFRAGFASG